MGRGCGFKTGFETEKDMKRITVLYGGQSPEHEVSCVSARFVAKILQEAGYLVDLIGITRDGSWYLQDTSVMQNIASLESLPISEDAQRVSVHPHKGFMAGELHIECDCVFPVMHGKNGEDGSIHALIHMLDIPCTGAPHIANAVAMHKVFAKRIWRDAGLPVLPFRWIRSLDFEDTITRGKTFALLEREIGFPMFIKPTGAGSSCGVSKVIHADGLEVALLEAFSIDDSLLVEPAKKVREFEVSVIGNTELTSFPPGEIIVNDEFYSYDAKYSKKSTTNLAIPARIDVALQGMLQKLAEQAYSLVDCKGYARVDLFLDTETQELYINELNTIPGFTSISMFPKLIAAQGSSYTSLVKQIVQLAMHRHHNATLPAYK